MPEEQAAHPHEGQHAMQSPLLTRRGEVQALGAERLLDDGLPPVPMEVGPGRLVLDEPVPGLPRSIVFANREGHAARAFTPASHSATDVNRNSVRSRSR